MEPSYTARDTVTRRFPPGFAGCCGLPVEIRDGDFASVGSDGHTTAIAAPSGHNFVLELHEGCVASTCIPIMYEVNRPSDNL